MIYPNVRSLEIASGHTVYSQQLYGNDILYPCIDGGEQAETQNLFENPFGRKHSYSLVVA